MASRLADRLNAARHRQFVGRTAEQELFRAALTDPDPSFYVLHIFGPGGVGKTALLHEFVHICEETQTEALYLDARDIEPAPRSFQNILQAAMGLTPSDSVFEFLAAKSARYVLLIDTFETLTPLDRWLRQRFLPQLPDNVFTVLSGRNAPGLAWHTDLGWQSLVRTLPLRNLSSEETITYLNVRQIPPVHHPAILDFTHGHPLALSLVADLYAQRRHTLGDFQAEVAPDMIKLLLERLVQKVPGPAHRTALEAIAIARVTTEGLLAAMLALPAPEHGAHELFEWLRRLSFIEATPAGLFPHDLVREALNVELRWRNPDWYAELHRRARQYYRTRLEQSSGQAQQRYLFDLVHLHRDNPVVRPFFEWQTSSDTLSDVMREADKPKLAALVAKHEGADSARLAGYWLDRQPEGALVFRDGEGEPSGFMFMLALQRVGSTDLETDPAAEASWRYLKNYAPLRSGEKATLFRFWLGRDTYQAVAPVQSLAFINAVRHYLTTPGLAFTLFPCAEPDFWATVFAYADLKRLPEADFTVGGRRYGVYGHDWRVVPPVRWLELLSEREVATEIQVAPTQVHSESLLVLSHSDFEAAVKQALTNLLHPEVLRTNPLLRSRLVASQVEAGYGEAERVIVLQSLLKEAAESLQVSPRETKYYRALYHTCFQPTATQEQAAELLDLPFSTFRRYLKLGITHVIERLWQRELEGP